MRPTCSKRSGFGLIALGAIVQTIFCVTQRNFAPMAGVLEVSGLVVLLYTGLRRLINAVSRPVQDAYSEGYESGYDKGWRDARERPKLIAIR